MPALAVALELPRAAPHRRFGEIDAIGLEPLRHLRRDRLAAVLGQFRLGIEGVDVAHAAVHEEVDHGFGARREMRRLWAPAGLFGAGGFQHPGQGQRAEPASGFDQQFASANKVSCDSSIHVEKLVGVEQDAHQFRGRGFPRAQFRGLPLQERLHAGDFFGSWAGARRPQARPS